MIEKKTGQERFAHLQGIMLLTLLSACSETQQTTAGSVRMPVPADRVFVNGGVYTVDSERSWAQAVAVHDGEIVFVGDNDAARPWIDDETEVIDLTGSMMLPGFHDSHIHLLIGVATDKECDLLRLDTLDAVESELTNCRKLDGFGEQRWVIGSGWTEWLWPDAKPDKAQLDRVFPDRPVYLTSSYGHSAWVNSRAMQLAGIDANRGDPPQGVIERDPETGEPSGTLRDAAMMIVEDVLPGMSMAHRIARIRAAIEMAHSFGITALIEPGLDDDLIGPVVELADAGELELRVLASLSPIDWHPGSFDDRVYDILERRERWRRANLDVDSVKIYMDGVIESGTGALLEAYHGGNYGLGPRFYSQQQVDGYLTRFDAMGIQVHVHAIGDAGVRMALDGFEAARRANGVTGNRHHIVHLQLIDEADIRRFAELNVSATFQALWAYPEPSVTDLAVPMIGEERAFSMYPIGSVNRSGGRIVGGSDFFVTDMNPLQAIEVAVTRQDPYSNEGPRLNADERVDLGTMIDAYTINGAYLMGLDDRQGSIEVGKRADLIIIDRNLFEIPPGEINEASVVMTVFDGKTVYSKDVSAVR